MTYRLLAVDLDGTLLRSDGRVDDKDIAAIRELRAAGVTVTIVTGRLHSGALFAANTCGIEGAIGCMEGSHLVEVAGKTLHHHAMKPADTQLLRTAFGSHGLASFIFEADGIHHDERGEPYARYVSTWSPRLRLVEQALDVHVWANGPLAAVAIGEPDEVAAAHGLLREHAADIFSVSFAVSSCPGKHAVLVRAAGPNKGTALRALCEGAGCTLAEAVAVGDWVNDVPMFEVAGRSFVMGDTPDHVRTKATDRLARPTGAGGGIAEAVRRAWG
jgi:Cof subfamily protein (haloacid dehalogenase superfamily)